MDRSGTPKMSLQVSSLQDFHGSKVRTVLDRVVTLKARHLQQALSVSSSETSPAVSSASLATLRSSAAWLMPKMGRLLHVFDFGFSDACKAQGNLSPLQPSDWSGQVSRWATTDPVEAPPLAALSDCVASITTWLRADPNHVAFVLAPSAAQLAILLACQAAANHVSSPLVIDALSAASVAGSGPPRSLQPEALLRLVCECLAGPSTAVTAAISGGVKRAVAAARSSVKSSAVSGGDGSASSSNSGGGDPLDEEAVALAQYKKLTVAGAGGGDGQSRDGSGSQQPSSASSGVDTRDDRGACVTQALKAFGAGLVDANCGLLPDGTPAPIPAPLAARALVATGSDGAWSAAREDPALSGALTSAAAHAAAIATANAAAALSFEGLCFSLTALAPYVRTVALFTELLRRHALLRVAVASDAKAEQRHAACLRCATCASGSDAAPHQQQLTHSGSLLLAGLVEDTLAHRLAAATGALQSDGGAPAGKAGGSPDTTKPSGFSGFLQRTFRSGRTSALSSPSSAPSTPKSPSALGGGGPRDRDVDDDVGLSDSLRSGGASALRTPLRSAGGGGSSRNSGSFGSASSGVILSQLERPGDSVDQPAIALPPPALGGLLPFSYVHAPAQLGPESALLGGSQSLVRPATDGGGAWDDRRSRLAWPCEGCGGLLLPMASPVTSTGVDDTGNLKSSSTQQLVLARRPPLGNGSLALPRKDIARSLLGRAVLSRAPALELVIPAPPTCVIRWLSLSRAPLMQPGEILHSEAGFSPSVMILAVDALSGELRLLYTSMVHGRKRYRHGHGPVLVPLHCVVAGEVVVRVFDMSLSGEGTKMFALRLHTSALTPHAPQQHAANGPSSCGNGSEWATVTHIKRGELGIPSSDCRYDPAFHVTVVSGSLPPDVTASTMMRNPIIGPPKRVRAPTGPSDTPSGPSTTSASAAVSAGEPGVALSLHCHTPGCGLDLPVPPQALHEAAAAVRAKATERARRFAARRVESASRGVPAALVSQDYDDPEPQPLSVYSLRAGVRRLLEAGGDGGRAGAADAGARKASSSSSTGVGSGSGDAGSRDASAAAAAAAASKSANPPPPPPKPVVKPIRGGHANRSAPPPPPPKPGLSLRGAAGSSGGSVGAAADVKTAAASDADGNGVFFSRSPMRELGSKSSGAGSRQGAGSQLSGSHHQHQQQQVLCDGHSAPAGARGLRPPGVPPPPAPVSRTLHRSLPCPGCGEVQYVPPVALVAAGVCAADEACAPVIPAFDARVRLADSSAARAAATAHPFDVSAKQEGSAGVAFTAMVAARKRARAAETSEMAQLVRAFPMLEERFIAEEYRATMAEDGEMEDVVVNLSMIAEALEKEGVLPPRPARREALLADLAVYEAEMAEAGAALAAGAPGSPAGPGGRPPPPPPPADAGPRSLAQRIGVAGSGGCGADGSGDWVMDASDDRLFEGGSALRPGHKLRTVYGTGTLLGVRLSVRPPAPSLPPPTPITCDVTHVAVRLPWGVAIVERDCARFAAQGESDSPDPSASGLAQDKISGIGRTRADRLADAIADADAVLARRMQAEAIADAMAEAGEDVDFEALLAGDDGAAMMAHTLSGEFGGLRSAEELAYERAMRLGVPYQPRPRHVPFSALHPLPPSLYVSHALARSLSAHTARKASTHALGAPGSLDGLAGADVLVAGEDAPAGDAAALLRLRTSRITSTAPVLQEARSEAMLRSLVEGTTFDRASARAADPDVIQSLPTFAYAPSESAEAAGGGGTGEGHTCCVICRDDYEEGDLLRTLGCGHSWHARCLDPWLLTDSRCPLCLKHVTKAAIGRR